MNESCVCVSLCVCDGVCFALSLFCNSMLVSQFTCMADVHALPIQKHMASC